MKTIHTKILVILFAVAALSSCEDDSAITVMNDSAETGPAQLSISNLVLQKESEDETALTIDFLEPDFGYNAGSIGYQLLFDLEVGDFSAPEIVDGGSEYSVSLTHAELNSIALNLGAEPGTETSLKVMIETVLSTDSSLYSEPSALTLTPYASILDLSSIWGLVGSATVNGWDGPDMPFYKTETTDEFVAYVTLVDGAIKIRANNDWTVNYGDNESDGTLDSGGNDILVTAGTYRILFNASTLSYSIVSYSWGIVGSATTNGWDGPDMPLTYDSYSDQWRAIVKLSAGEIKIRANNDWVTNYGDVELDGILDTEENNNISVSSGNYIVTVNFNDLTYSLEPLDNIWGLVGSAYNNWGETPDAQFTRDWSTENDIWVLDSVTLLEGDFKIRANNDWAISYGDAEPDGILDTSENNNISVVAGTYTITLDFSNPSNPTYTIE
ncbi:SusE domain-containing protein [Muricauda sp. ANG21]|uniref:SusE domain-containing protein n=1 Tax=Allomuricauda sp. ANG21 TaxID=3042468 RepID=UPI003454D6B1